MVHTEPNAEAALRATAGEGVKLEELVPTIGDEAVEGVAMMIDPSAFLPINRRAEGNSDARASARRLAMRIVDYVRTGNGAGGPAAPVSFTGGSR